MEKARKPARTAHAAHAARESMSFVTAATAGRRPIFEISRVADMFVETLLHYRMQGYYKLHAYVVMPDHIELLLTPRRITLEQAMQLIRSGFVHRLETSVAIWEEGFTAYAVANLHDLEVVRAYLHEMPVHAGLAASAELYPHSSAFRPAIVEFPGRAASAVATSASSTATSGRKKAS